MKLIAWIVAFAALGRPPRPTQKPEVRLAELAAAVLNADYRGDRPQLAQAGGRARPTRRPARGSSTGTTGAGSLSGGGR